MIRIITIFSAFLILEGCASTPKTSDSAKSTETAAKMAMQDYVEASVAFHGGPAYNTARIHFVFRDMTYEGSWNQGAYVLSRSFEQDGQLFTDVLTTDSFERMINGQVIAVPDTMAVKYSSSVNSVWYFAMLPFRLLDPAVQLRDLGESAIRGKDYHKVEVTFAAEGGGEDFEDVFVYWFDQEDYSLDYLAYSYAEDDGLGIRFREAVNPRRVGGILWQDYVNYKADPDMYEVHELDAAFTAGKLDTLSMIVLEELVVD